MPASNITERGVQIDAGTVVLDGDLRIPSDTAGIVVFAHGSGSSRHSPRNRQVADTLSAAGLATLLFDLLTADEEREDARTGHLRFDVDLLGDRVGAALTWLEDDEELRQLPVGCFGASTGAAAALIAAATHPDAVRAVVSRGGRPDLTPVAHLAHVRTPVLLIVGGDDEPVIEMNRDAMAALDTETRLQIVPGASHLFEEPGTLDQVARLAADWFRRHLGGHGGGGRW